eukprot:tig00021257_g19755.t1
MEPSTKRARPDIDAGQASSSAAAAAAKSSVTDTDAYGSVIDVLPDALLERIFSEHLGAAEAWRTARQACRKWRRLVEEIEWCELQVDGTRPETFRTLAAVVRSGRLRLRRGGAAAVELDINYLDLDLDVDVDRMRSSSPDDTPTTSALNEELLAEAEVDAPGHAAHDALRACVLAAGGLRHVAVFHRVPNLDLERLSRDVDIDRQQLQHLYEICRCIIPSQLFSTLRALQPPRSTTSHVHLSSLIIADDDRPVDDDHIEEEEEIAAGISGGALRHALAPFSRLQLLLLPNSIRIDQQHAAAIAASCPALQRLWIRPLNDDALVGLSSLSKLEELRLWCHNTLILGSGFAEFAASPAGRNLRILGDTIPEQISDDDGAGTWCRGADFAPATMRALPAMRSLERLLFTKGLSLIKYDGQELAQAREAVACLGACPKLAELSYACSAGSAVDTEVLHGLADALERSSSLRHLDLLLVICGGTESRWPRTEDWGPYGEALRRLLAAAAPVLRSAAVFFIDDSDVDYERNAGKDDGGPARERPGPSGPRRRTKRDGAERRV